MNITLIKGLTDAGRKKQMTFDFEDFKNKIIADMKVGKSLVDKDGIFTPIIWKFGD